MPPKRSFSRFGAGSHTVTKRDAEAGYANSKFDLSDQDRCARIDCAWALAAVVLRSVLGVLRRACARVDRARILAALNDALAHGGRVCYTFLKRKGGRAHET